MEFDISTIADDEPIPDIFRFPQWTVDDGMDFLVGIYKVRDVDGAAEVVTLDGKIYREPDHAMQVNALFARCDRARAIWDHGKWTRDSYPKSTFIKWGLRHRDIVKLSWLSDAQKKGFVPLDIDKPKVAPEKELRENERISLLRIIAGLCLKAYGKSPDQHGILKLVTACLDNHGYHVAEGTLSKHMSAAAKIPPNKHG